MSKDAMKFLPSFHRKVNVEKNYDTMHDESKHCWIHWLKAQTPSQGASFACLVLWNWSYTMS